MQIYENFFSEMKDRPITLVEIGVAEGASMKTWSEYFTKGRIIGIDCCTDWLPDPGEDITILECNVNNGSRLAECCEEIESADIVIDDGSHIAVEQLDAFRKLWEIVKPGGWYVVEDLFALYDEVWNPGPEYVFPIAESIINGPQNIIEEIMSRMKSILVGGDEIQEVHWFGRNNINGIVFLRKRYEPYRIQPLEEFKM